MQTGKLGQQAFYLSSILWNIQIHAYFVLVGRSWEKVVPNVSVSFLGIPQSQMIDQIYDPVTPRVINSRCCYLQVIVFQFCFELRWLISVHYDCLMSLFVPTTTTTGSTALTPSSPVATLSSRKQFYKNVLADGLTVLMQY